MSNRVYTYKYNTIEECIQATKDVESIPEYISRKKAAYNTCLRNNWWGEVRLHIKRKLKFKAEYTKEYCIETIKSYRTPTEFVKQNRFAYEICVENDWWSEVKTYSKNEKIDQEIYNFEKCVELTKDMKYFSEFSKKHSSIYKKCKKNGWLNLLNLENDFWRPVDTFDIEHCKNPEKFKNQVFKRELDRCVYEIHFENNVIYVGLTYSFKRRLRDHLNSGGSVFEYIQTTGQQPIKCEIVSEGYIPQEEAKQMEKYLIYDYKQKGYAILNRAKAGSLGGNIIRWTKENIAIEALKYNRRIDFNRGSKGAYYAARQNGWLDDVCGHMTPYEIWTLENLVNIAKNYTDKVEFRKKEPLAYIAACSKKVLEQICSHMPPIPPIWTIEMLQEIALRFNKKVDFLKSETNAYSAATRRGILNDICKHMEQRKKWNLDELKEVTLKYKSKVDFYKNEPSAYNTLSSMGLLKEMCSHMIKKNKNLTLTNN